MRTTVNIDDDVLDAGRELAHHHRKSIGEVLSDLARKGLRPPTESPLYRNGVRQMPTAGRSAIVTTAMVNRLRDELE
jgi:hypothetical protein